MKNFKTLLATAAISIFAISCSSDDDSIPEIINETEVITTSTITLVPTTEGLPTITLNGSDEDGIGGEDPTITVSGPLAANETYSASISLLNETLEETDEGFNALNDVIEEDLDHQFFYAISEELNITTEYEGGDFALDSEGNPFGATFTLTTGAASTGTLTLVLRHELDKADGEAVLETAGGETEVNTSYPIEIVETAETIAE